MPNIFKLACPMRIFEKLHHAAETRGEPIDITKRDLRLFLTDHSRMIGKLRDLGITIEGDT